MEGKLIKTSKDSYHNGHYFLNDDNGFAIGSSDKDWCKKAVKKRPLYVLSLTNCQSIERGYDLDELFNEVDESIDYHEFDFTSFRLGFQKALEILGDKKFSEQDVKKIIHWSTLDKDVRLSEEELFQSLQKTEWDVVIEMEEPLTAKSRQIHGDFVAGKLLESSVFPNPKLDSEGCLILKRK